MLTSFELALASLAAAAPDPDWGALTAVAVPPCVPPEHAAAAATPADLEHQLTTVCMLGMRYVNLHGQGLFANLAGKKARGPVDTYNLICDLVSELRRRSRRQRGAAATDAAAATSPSSPCGTATPSDKAAAGDSGSGGGQAASAEATTGDSSSLARGCGLEIIGPCHKFLAVDIMFCNRSFDDDAFAGGKVPGWFYFLRDRQKLEGPLSDFAAPPRAAAAAASNNDDQESSAH